MNAPPRRNDPCPCGSGLRYKECHGKLDAAGPPTAQRVQRALQLHQAGRTEEAERLYRDVLREEPGNAVAVHYLGLIAWARGDRLEAERLMREALAKDATVPDFHNNLGLLLRDTHRVDEAITEYRRAIEIEPRWMDAYSNLGLALEAAGRDDEAVAAYERALAREPRFAIGHQNLALALLKRGAFRDAWLIGRVTAPGGTPVKDARWALRTIERGGLTTISSGETGSDGIFVSCRAARRSTVTIEFRRKGMENGMTSRTLTDELTVLALEMTPEGKSR